jgi:hypothetical protein
MPSFSQKLSDSEITDLRRAIEPRPPAAHQVASILRLGGRLDRCAWQKAA